jgi:hypothetical protein
MSCHTSKCGIARNGAPQPLQGHANCSCTADRKTTACCATYHSAHDPEQSVVLRVGQHAGDDRVVGTLVRHDLIRVALQKAIMQLVQTDTHAVHYTVPHPLVLWMIVTLAHNTVHYSYTTNR